MLFVITPRKSVEDLRDLIKSVRDRGFPYEGREQRDRNWSPYDQAQINEIAEILETIRDIVDEASSRIETKKRGPGRPAVPPSDVVKVISCKAYFGMPNRVAQGFLRLFGEKLGIGTRFSYKTIERGYDSDRSRAILDDFNENTMIFLIPKSNSRIRGIRNWREIIRRFMDDPMSYLREYFKRNASESEFFSDKMTTGGLIYQRRKDRKETSGFCKGLIHNLMLLHS